MGRPVHTSDRAAPPNSTPKAFSAIMKGLDGSSPSLVGFYPVVNGQRKFIRDPTNNLDWLAAIQQEYTKKVGKF